MPRKKMPLAENEAAHRNHTFSSFELEESDRKAGKKGYSRIMYIENKSGRLAGGEACIGRVTFSKTHRTIYYQNRAFQSFKGGCKANYFETETGDPYWISGPKKDGSDRLYAERVPVKIDEDIREEYWTAIRNLPEKKNQKQA